MTFGEKDNTLGLGNHFSISMSSMLDLLTPKSINCYLHPMGSQYE
jgi:hypothetical protein